VTLDTRWRILGRDGDELAFRRSTVIEAATGSGHEPMVAAMARALGTLGREIAAAIRTLPEGVDDERTRHQGTRRSRAPRSRDLLLAALGSCTSMTIGLYARRKQWPLEAVRVRLRHSKIHAADCEACETKDAMIDRIDCDVELVGSLDGNQRARLLDIANKCPVHRTLTSEIAIRTQLAPEGSGPLPN
jgi:putative redox protein